MSGAEPSLIASFEDEMRKLGYSPGMNIHIETRIARWNTNDTAVHAAELGAMDLDLRRRRRVAAGPSDAAGEPENAAGDHHVPGHGE
jgi:hypothetical protein